MKIKEQSFKTSHPHVCYYTVYTILFTVLILGIFYPFYHSNKIMAWIKDAPSILYPAFSYLGKFLKESISNMSFNTYDLGLGLGNDIFSFLGTWYLDPLSFFSLLIPEKYMEEAYLGIIILRFYFVGIAFSIYSLYMKNKLWPTLISSFVYTFSIYALVFGVKWPEFLMPMIYLPLLLVGIEKIINSKNAFSFTLVIFISAGSSYYYLYINTIICAIYYLIRIFELHKKNNAFDISEFIFLNRSLITIRAYIIGIGMSCMTLLPNIFIFLNSNRSSGVKQSVENLMYYGKGWLGGLLKYVIAPVKLWAYSPLPEFDLFIGVIPICFLSIIILFFNRKLKADWKLKTFSIILGLFLLIPFFAYVLSGFNVINHRWAYAFALFITFIFAKYLPEYPKLNKLTLSILVLYGICYGFLVYREEKENIYVQIALIILVISLIGIIISNVLHFTYTMNMSWIMLSVIISLMIFSDYLYSENKGNMLYEYANVGELEKLSNGTITNEIKKIKDADDSLFRIDEGKTVREGLNASALNDYYGCSFYNNVMDKNIAKYMQSLSNSGLRENIICLGLDSRTYLEEIAGVKYYIPSDESSIPYGYHLNKQLSSEGKNIYENQYALPLGFLYTDTVSEKEFENYNPLEKQELMLKALVLDTDKQSKSNYSFHSQELKVKTTFSNLSYKNKKITLDDEFYSNGGYIELEFSHPNNSEVYLVLDGIDIDDAGFADWSFSIEDIECGTWKEKSILSNYNTYNPGMNIYYINLGYEKQGSNHHIRLHIPPNASDFSLDKIAVYSQSFDGYISDVEKLQANTLHNIKLTNNTLTGNIDPSKSGWLYFSVPYSKGWSAYVNNEKVDISKANIMYMAIPLEKGSHNIRLEYHTPGLKPGLAISLISWIIFMIIHIKAVRKNPQNRKFIFKRGGN